LANTPVSQYVHIYQLLARKRATLRIKRAPEGPTRFTVGEQPRPQDR